MDWQTSVLKAIRRLCTKQEINTFSREMLIDKELYTIVKETNSQGKTPSQTLSRILQELRDLGFIEFIDNKGNYKLL